MKYSFTLLCILFMACNAPRTEETSDALIEVNPASQGFNMESSDASAIAIADNVMEAMGGREAWDKTQYIKWNFFGRRDLTWNKVTGDVRIDSPRDSMVYLLNVETMEGSVYKDLEELSDPEVKTRMLERGKAIWINDSYWLVMPFKLKDSGVTLKYLRTDTTLIGTTADVLQLTFEEVGVTPQNKYEVWVDKSDHLVKQWAYFREASQDSASSIWPFDNYKNYGNILLSADRSDGRGPGNVQVFEDLNPNIFTDPAPVKWD